MNIAESILYLEPYAEFSCGETLDSIIWHSTDIERPTDEQIISAWKVVEKKIRNEEYLRQRKEDKDWPSIEEKVDALYKKLANNDASELNDIQSRIQAVEQKYPKPEEK